MNLSGLQTFLAIIETGSLARAALRLNVTQSTVTARLQSLEAEVGQPLINRQKSGATLTAAGMRLERYADTISDLWRQARQETSLPDRYETVCNIGCHPNLWSGFGERMVETLRQEHAEVALSVWRGDQLELDRWLDSGRIDISLTHWPTANAAQTVAAAGGDQLRLFSSSPDTPVRFDPNYVFVEGGARFGRDHAIAFADASTARLSFGDAELGVQHILQKGGSAYLPTRIADPLVTNGRLYPIDEAPAFERPRYIIVNSTAAQGWDWLTTLIEDLTSV